MNTKNNSSSAVEAAYVDCDKTTYTRFGVALAVLALMLPPAVNPHLRGAIQGFAEF